jgi:tetratricopeptide (TPR) repeat protein
MVLEALSISHGKASAYLPVIDLLRNYFEISVADDERKRREKVAGKIAILDRSLEDTLPYLYSLLGIVEGDDPLVQTDGQIKKRRTLEAIKRILLRESLNQSLMIIFEDLHWMDGESEGLLNLLDDSIGTARLLLLVNYRPEYHHQWGSKTYYAQLRLDPLGKESAEEMLSALLAMPLAPVSTPLAHSVAGEGQGEGAARAGEGKPEDEPRAGEGADIVSLKRLILEKTEGNPLFIEEIIQSLYEDGTLARSGEVKLSMPLASLRIPPTLQGIIASRIDRLPVDEKDLLQTAAVIGMEFTLRVVRALSGKSDDELNRMLSDLQVAEFIYEQPAAGDVEFTFKHALTHDVAYNSLLTERRRLLHERVAITIEEQFADHIEDHLSELAHHFERSSAGPKAVEYLGRAAARAVQQGAHAEALGHFTRAIELLGRLPEDTARDSQELDMLIALSWSMYVTGGRRAPERESTLVRACELAGQLGDNKRLMKALVTMAHHRIGWSDYAQARELAQRALAMGQEVHTPAWLGGAHYVLGVVGFATGQFPAAREHLERAVELLRADSSVTDGAIFVQSVPQVYLGTLMILGYLSKAYSKTSEWLAAARSSSDTGSIGDALTAELMHHVLLRDTHMVAERTDEMLAYASEHSVAFYNVVFATFARAWAVASAGRVEEGMAEMRRSLSDPRVAESMIAASMVIALAEACGKSERFKEGLDLVNEGLATSERIGLRANEAELHRLKGELLLVKDPDDVVQSERCLRTAIEVAREQSAKLFELRATVSLARLLRDTGRRGEARAMLTEICEWFIEGFDTSDLREARQLLNKLEQES